MRKSILMIEALHRNVKDVLKVLLHYEAQKDGPFCYLFYIAEMNPSISVVCFLISL